MRWILPVLAVCALAPRPGWSAEPLARVAGVEITSGDVERLRSGLPPSLRDNDETWVLETLVTRELLIQEARRRGVDTTEAVRAGLELALVKKLRDLLFERAVVATVHASEQDLLEAFRQGPFAQLSEVRVAHIVVATLEEAEALWSRIAAGESFADLARENSLDGPSAARGGEIGVWRQGEVVGAVAEQAWSLETGVVSGPVQERDGRFHLVTVLERRPVGFEEQRGQLESRVIAAKTRQKRAAFMDSLLAAYDVALEEEAVLRLWRRGRTAVNRVPEAEPGDDTTALLRYRGGIVTLAQYRSWLLDTDAAGRRPYPVDRRGIEEMARRRTAMDRLYPLEARQRGLHLSPEVADWVRRKRDDLSIETLRRVAVEEVVITDAELERYYEEHRQRFLEPERLFVEVALAASPEDAQAICDYCEGGGDLAAAAAAHPLPASPANYRVFSLAEGEGDRLDRGPTPLVEAARKLLDPAAGARIVAFGSGAPEPIGASEPTGASEPRYAVLRIVERRAARVRPPSDLAVRDEIREALEEVRVDDLEGAFGDLVARLREQHADQIQYLSRGAGE